MAKSISKAHVALDAARLVVRDAFGDGARLVDLRELTDGWFNAAYELALEDGRAFVLKVAPPPDVAVLRYERDIIRAEVEALTLVRARTSAPVPEVVWFDDSGRRVRSPLFVMTRMPGESLRDVRASLSQATADAIDAALGRYLRSINDIVGDEGFGLLAPTARRHSTWRAAFGELFEWVLLDGERNGVALPVAYDVVRRTFAEAASALDEVADPRLVYWDLWDGNVLVDPERGEVTGMLDVERAMWGDPLIELQMDPQDAKAELLKAYGTRGPTTATELTRRALYTLYLHLVMSVEGSFRQYPTDPGGDWARAQLATDVLSIRGS